MAKKIKPRADVAEITSGFEELPIINSRPIDVFVLHQEFLHQHR